MRQLAEYDMAQSIALWELLPRCLLGNAVKRPRFTRVSPFIIPKLEVKKYYVGEWW
jgi:hypothetical protein